MVIIRKRRKRRIMVAWGLLLTFLLCCACAVYFKVRPLIVKVAISNAETILLNAANEAVIEILKEQNTQYNDIARLSYDSKGYVTSLQTDINRVNLLKSSISNKISSIISKNEFYKAKIPLGTFFGNELFSGMGPRFSFDFQLTATSVVDFEHEFNDAGINQVLHKIIIKIDTKGCVITSASTEGFRVSTSAIAAQTVIVGIAPDSFTQVIESPTSDTAGIINDYGAY